jgi:ubiquinone/menaquinone biosynthesis C-methylase UbiE
MSSVLRYAVGMKHEIKKQYNDFSNTYSENINYDEPSNSLFYKQFGFELKDKKVLDVGCGDGSDLKKMSEKGAVIYGVEPSEEFVKYAKQLNPSAIIKEGVAENIPFSDGMFDVVVSKWALQTCSDLQKALDEIGRVLKPGGIFVLLSKHPMQQYFGKMREHGNMADYFEQKVSTLHIFNGKITLKEPTHTLNEYLNNSFLSKFELVDFKESFDFPASERFHDGTYPTFFIIKACKK